MNYFDYQAASREAGLSPDQLMLLAQAVRRDYPSDEMLFELHMLRACRAIRDQVVSFEQAISEPASA